MQLYKSYVLCWKCSIIAQIDDTLIINSITALASLGLHDKALGEFEEANRILPNNDGIIKDMERVKMLLKNREFETDSSEEDFWVVPNSTWNNISCSYHINVPRIWPNKSVL